MNALLLDGSGLTDDGHGNSYGFLQIVREKIEIAGVNTQEFSLQDFDSYTQIAIAMSESEAVVMSLPVYYSSIPAFILRFMSYIEKVSGSFNNTPMLYFIHNSGFFEKEEADNSVDQMEIWCKKCGFDWGQAVTIGAGEMMIALKDKRVSMAPHATTMRNLSELASKIVEKGSGLTLYSEPDGIEKYIFFCEANKRWGELR